MAKRILPEASNVWWDNRDKGNRMELKFSLARPESAGDHYAAFNE
jgi:hypothetical protein